jgi:hypothetical protein
VPKRFSALAALALASTALMAQTPQQQPPGAQDATAPAPFVAEEAKAAVEKLATSLEESFVFPEVGSKYAAALRAKLASGGYSSFPDASAFAAAVTADLKAVHEDRHLRVRALPPQGAGDPSRAAPRTFPPAIEKAGWIADGVAYISFLAFPGDEPTLARLRTFLAEHKDAKALIIDARGHHGGGLAEMDLMFPYFYGKPQTLVTMDTRIAVEERQGSPLEEGPTLVREKGPQGVVRRSHKVIPAAETTGLRTARIFLLTSKRTASAAEHLSMSLKRTGRAVLIGETTRGAGHYGGGVSLGGGYSVFIPVGRTFDPDTNQGWEGTGVKPDVEVPADQALDEALRRAGVEPAKAKSLASLN